MGDAEFIMNQDIKDRKSMISGYRNKVNGSKSKKCTLPSDYLTRSQMKKLNGECITIKMGEPMTWSDFKKMDRSHQEAYLSHLINKYQVGYVQLADMFGTKNTVISQYVSKHNFTSVKPNKKKLTADQLEVWDKFLHPVADIECSDSVNTSKYEKYEAVEKKFISPNKNHSDANMKIPSIDITFEGEINFNDIVTYLKLVTGDNPVGKLKISFTVEDNHE